MELFCRWCKESKPVDEVVKRNANLPYSQSNTRACKECNTRRNRERYKVPALREKQLRANSKWRKANPSRMRRAEERLHLLRPEQRKARNRVRHLLRRGRWGRQPCCICGNEIAEAHHDSYAKPHWEVVRWLCKEHHEKWHTTVDPIKRRVRDEYEPKLFALREDAERTMAQIRVLREQYRDLVSSYEALHLKMWNKVIEETEPHWKVFSSN